MQGLRNPFSWLLAALLLFAPLAQAAQVTSAHSIVSVTPQATGGVVTLNISFTNTGSSDLYAVEATEQSFLGGSNPAASMLGIGNLPAGQSVNLSWTITTSNDLQQLQPGVQVDLPLQIKATDAAGNPVVEDILSAGGK